MCIAVGQSAQSLPSPRDGPLRPGLREKLTMIAREVARAGPPNEGTWSIVALIGLHGYPAVANVLCGTSGTTAKAANS